jgi:hypothetical protein
MERSRRDVLGLAGVSVATLAAGCLDDTGSAGGSSGTPTDGSAGTPTEPAETPTDGAETPTGPATDGGLPADLERVDEPPYRITVPDCGDDTDRDPLYLCANMPSEPSLSFTQEAARGSVLEDSGLELGDESGNEMFATLLTGASDTDRLAEDASGGAAQLVEATDFDSHAVLIVETGWGSGSVVPHVKRVETTDDGVHAFGCHSAPCIVTSDYISRTVAVRFERPGTVETGVASLTVAADERWNVAAGEGAVTIPSE